MEIKRWKKIFVDGKYNIGFEYLHSVWYMTNWLLETDISLISGWVCVVLDLLLPSVLDRDPWIL